MSTTGGPERDVAPADPDPAVLATLSETHLLRLRGLGSRVDLTWLMSGS